MFYMILYESYIYNRTINLTGEKQMPDLIDANEIFFTPFEPKT